MKIKKVLVSHMTGFNIELKSIVNVLEKYGIKAITKHRKILYRKYFDEVDMAISLGGDGTFLRTSHFIYSKLPVLGINPDPKNKEGFFNSSSVKDFESKLELILKNKMMILPLARLKAKINGILLDDLALNEFYFGRSTGHHMSKYILRIGKTKEVQKSSGVLVGVPQSTHSWIGSAGGVKMLLTSKNFQFIVREPYHGTLTWAKVTQGILKSNQKIYLSPLSRDFSLVLDSLKEYRLSPDDKVVISKSNKNLNLIHFGKKR